MVVYVASDAKGHLLLVHHEDAPGAGVPVGQKPIRTLSRGPARMLGPFVGELRHSRGSWWIGGARGIEDAVRSVRLHESLNSRLNLHLRWSTP